MSPTTESSRVLQAVEALKRFDRAGAVALLREEFELGPRDGERWRSVSRLCETIGEIPMAIAAGRRFAATLPVTLDRVIELCRLLARHSRNDETKAELDRLPAHVQAHPLVQQVRGTVATQSGDFNLAEDSFRKAIAQEAIAPQSWFALSVIKTFAPGDPDIAHMERLREPMKQVDDRSRAQFLYALAKAYDDCGETDRAASVYAEGAALMRALETPRLAEIEQFADRLIADYTPDMLARLTPSRADGSRMIFVNGLPRSGTTLVEQILTSHSQVHDGAELNLLRAALIPAGSYDLAGAFGWQARSHSHDPWGDLARDYLRMVEDRFGAGPGRIIDKTLNHSRFMGLLMHCLPKARVIWLRRDPDDNALSCYRTFFTAPVAWSWSFEDIAAYFRMEDRLHAHWASIYPDRILTVPYESLTRDQAGWTRAILAHAGLSEEPQTFSPHTHERSVMTASVAQVRRPVSTSRIGAAKAYGDALNGFRRAYYG